MRKLRIILVFLFFSLFLVSCWGDKLEEKIEENFKSVNTQKIKKEDFYEEINLIWKIAPIIETSISPQSSWIIKLINIDVWNSVIKDQILASIDLKSSPVWVNFDNANLAYNNLLDSYKFTQESIKNDLESAKIQLDNSLKTKTNTYASTDAQLKLAQTQLENITKTKSNTINSTNEAIKSAKIWVDLAQKSLDNANSNIINFEKNSLENLNILETKKRWLYDNSKVTLQNAIVIINSAIVNADKLLWISDKFKNINDAYEIYLWAKNSSYKHNSESAFFNVQNLFDNLPNKTELTEENINDYLLKIINLVNAISALYDNLINLLDNSITSSSFSQTQIDTIKWSPTLWWIAWMQYSINQLKVWLVGLSNSFDDINNSISSTKTNIETTKISLENAKNIAQTQLDNAIQNLKNLEINNINTIDNISWNESLIKAQLESSIANIKQARDNVDNALKIAQTQYDSVKAKLNASSVQSKSQLDSAKWWKNIASIQLNNSNITAPFSWIIMSKNIEIWGLVSPWLIAFTIWNIDQLKVKLEVSSENISNLKLWQIVRIQKNNNIFTWSISLLSPAADLQTKLFKMEVILDKWVKWLNVWDYVDAFIITKKRNDKVILIPFSALIDSWQWNYKVFILNNDTIESRSVKLWSQNSTWIEIVSWLKEWDNIVVEWALNLKEGDKVSL